ncbi:peptide deformylase [Niabella hibiscisoli]|uniref:peptide deformylase n=1 Tax=Niabella hibiscisoli TaxID=1825928 RepID=UPI001F10DAD1|nr:peptide deformylase [Niabella hibiscisoli]MCH5715937.1 peptide deformylase [Niabella hibiscisoli]
MILLISNSVNAQNFTDAERKIILSGDTSSMLRVIPLMEPAGAKALKAMSKDIQYNDPLLPLLKNRMLKSVLDSSRRGVGIAAPQVGINRNLIWVQRFDKAGQPFEFYINPKIVWRSSILCQGPEGDLSFEGRGEVVRSFSIMVSYTDIQGAQHIEILEDFSAIIFQHETDHLFGTLFTDRIEEQKTKKFVPFKPVRATTLLKEQTP